MEAANGKAVVAALTEDQSRALEVLMRGGTQEEAARAAASCARTVRNWLRTPEFRTALNEARTGAWTETTSLLQCHTREAVATLTAVMRDDKARGWERVAAAKALLDQSRRAVEVDDVQLRLAEVEAKLEAALSGSD
jgi:hypothetical protein